MERAQVLIVEDQTLIARNIESILKKNGMDVVAIFKTGEEALAYCKRHIPDLILMDIKLAGKINGIETAQAIASEAIVPVIYITDYGDASTFRKAKTTAPVNFISKPFTEPDLIRAAELAIFNANKTRGKHAHRGGTDFIFLKTAPQKWSRLEYDNILFLQADRMYCNIVCSDNTYSVSVNLSAVHDQLGEKLFFKVHRSYVVNLKKITGFSRGEITINSFTIPVSDRHRMELTNRLKLLR